jgi:magnesium-transporting ATPase (P-type)
MNGGLKMSDSEPSVHMAPGDKAGKRKLNVYLLIALIIGVIYLIYSISYWGGANSGQGTSSAQAGAAIATMLVFPHLVVTAIAVIFNALALFMRKPAFALVAGILYAVAMALFIVYFFFVIAEMILSFVGYSQLKKQV